MSWLARLKKNECVSETDTTKPTKPGFIGFVGTIPEHFQKSEGEPGAANDPAPRPDPDPWAWPRSTAMSGAELDTFTARLARFTDKGLDLDAGERWADKLVLRDRESDERHICLECTHLQQVAVWRCGNWQRAGVAVRAKDAQLATEFVNLLQRCEGFTQAIHSHHDGSHHGQA